MNSPHAVGVVDAPHAVGVVDAPHAVGVVKGTRERFSDDGKATAKNQKSGRQFDGELTPRCGGGGRTPRCGGGGRTPRSGGGKGNESAF
jgi:hypothetical protein